MIRRARLLAVVATRRRGRARRHLVDADVARRSSLDDGARHALAGRRRGRRSPVLAPLSLAVLALGGALSIVGLVLRYVFGVLTVAIAGLLGVAHAQVAFAHSDRRRSPSTVTDATGITGADAVAALVAAGRADGVAGRDPRRLGRAARGRRVHPRHRARRWRGSGRRYERMPRPRAASGSRGTGIPPASTRSTRGTTCRVARIPRDRRTPLD